MITMKRNQIRMKQQTMNAKGSAACLVIGCVLRLLVYEKSRNAKKYRRNEEYGSARWGTHSDIAPFIDPDPWNNVILTKTESLTMSSRPKDPRNARNGAQFVTL